MITPARRRCHSFFREPLRFSASLVQVRRGRAFSLLETTIAIGILGLGLIMIAAIFPVALSQHRDSVYQARATELVTKAEGILHGRVDPDLLHTSQDYLDLAMDTPWYLMPTRNIRVGANDTADGDDNWDDMMQGSGRYADYINGSFSFFWTPIQFYGLDMLSDRAAPFSTNNSLSPFTDAELMSAPNRLVWCGFFRRLANGNVTYAVAICRQQRNQFFAEQDVTDSDFASLPTARLSAITDARRLPVPWRVTVAVLGGTRVLYSNLAAPEGLGELAPVGSKIMIQGESYFLTGGRPPPVPAGRVLTVLDVRSKVAVEVLDDISDLPSSAAGASFDVWIMPPPVVGGDSSDTRFGGESPLIDWKVRL